MRPNSLAGRLIAAASLWSVVALVAAGLILTSLYRQSVEQGFDQRLGVYLKTLIGMLAAQTTPALSDPGNMGEPRFELPYSGWYWQVSQGDGGTVALASRSLYTDLVDTAKATGAKTVDDVTSGAVVGPAGQSLRFVSQTVTLDPSRTYNVLVAGDAGELQDQITAFRRTVMLTLAVFGIGLVVAITAQIRWGLRPLDRVRLGLTNLRSGKDHRLEGSFPAEIEPLVKELNALLESNRQVIERARTQVGNLAHALKTPLSVITNEARATRGPFAEKVAEQSAIMSRQVNHYLDRARIAARSNVIGAVTEVEPVIARLVRAMSRIHEDRGLRLSFDIPAKILFKGEQQDLEEIVGNLVDNACKWGRSSVTITLGGRREGNGDGPGSFTLDIDDDGPGLTAEERAEATRRGRRLDESKPGSGLGLSIVTDLVALYDGRFALDRSPAGGLRAEIELPAA